MCRPSASSVTAQVGNAGKGRGGIRQGTQRCDGGGELANVTHIALDALQRAVFGALGSDKARLLGDHGTHIHQNMPNGVARLGGIGRPALNGHAAAGDGSGGKERRGIG